MSRHTNIRSIKLFCFPYAGGSGYSFQPFDKYWPKNWEVKTITYPGRGHRFEEALLNNMDALLEDAWKQIEKETPPYVFLGHSLGSTLAFLLAHKAKAVGKQPVHIFLSGTGAPSYSDRNEEDQNYLLPKSAFKSLLKSYGGISNEILEEAAAFNIFEPIIRTDFQIVETWEYEDLPKLDIPATIITGTNEDLSDLEILHWKKEFCSNVRFIKMRGNHFYLFDAPEQFVNIIKGQLQNHDSQKVRMKIS